MKTIFLDRDGVINKDFGYVYKWDNFKFINGSLLALQNLTKHNFDQDIVQDVYYEIDLIQDIVQEVGINQTYTVDVLKTETRTRLVGE